MDSFAVAMGYFVGLQIGFILILLLKEIGAFRKMLSAIDEIYLEVATHPNIDRVVYIAGDAGYMVGGSVLGAGIYEYLIHFTLSLSVLLCGIVMILFGAYVREKTRKGKNVA